MMVGLEQQVAVARLPKLLVGGINYHTRSKLVLLGTYLSTLTVEDSLWIDYSK